MKDVIETFPKFHFCIEVSADFAEFTSKKDERISYDIPTSGAIRGFLQSIFWKPAILYIPRSVEVLNPLGQIVSIKKNEVRNKMSLLSRSKKNEEDEGDEGQENDVMKNRIQRNNVYLRNVRYRIHADLVFIPKEYRETEYRDDENPIKYYNMLRRRVTKGQYKYAPYLGTRECVCDEIEWIDENSQKIQPITDSIDYGKMYIDYLYHEDYTREERKQMLDFISKETGKNIKAQEIRPRAIVGHVEMKNGIVLYPSKFDLKIQMLQDMKRYWDKAEA